MITYACPNCGEELSVDDARAGTDYVCPACGNCTRIPGVMGTRPACEALLATQRRRPLNLTELDHLAQYQQELGQLAAAARTRQLVEAQRPKRFASVQCPTCKAMLTLDPPLPAGSSVTCGTCGAILTLESPAANRLRQANSFSQIGQGNEDSRLVRLLVIGLVMVVVAVGYSIHQANEWTAELESAPTPHTSPSPVVTTPPADPGNLGRALAGETWELRCNSVALMFLPKRPTDFAVFKDNIVVVLNTGDRVRVVETKYQDELLGSEMWLHVRYLNQAGQEVLQGWILADAASPSGYEVQGVRIW